MKKNLLVFSLIFSAFPFFGFAAETEASTEKEKSDGQKTTAGLCINKFKDNWALSLGIGADMYFGQGDGNLSFGKRPGLAVEINAEKWVTPVFGLRVGLDYNGFNGATRLENGVGVDGTLADNGFYRQSYGALMPHLDLMADFYSLFAGFDAKRIYSPILYVGAGVGVLVHSAKENDWHQACYTFRAGFLNRFRVADAWTVNLDLRIGSIENEFDGDNGNYGDFTAAVMVGATYKFNKRTWEAPVIPEPQVIRSKYTDEEGDALVEQLRRANEKISVLEQDVEKAKQALAEAQAERETARKAAVPTATIYFDADQSTLASKDATLLKALAKVMKENPDKKYRVTGYADNTTGTAEYNARLRQARADRVYNYLLRSGVSADQLEVTVSEDANGFGAYRLDRAATVTIVE